MIRNHSAVHEALESGATLLVPDAARARAVHAAFAAEQRALGRKVWRTPDILAAGAFFGRELGRLRAEGRLRERLMAPAEEWLWWRGQTESLTRAAPLPGVDAMARALRQSSFLVDEWRLPLRGNESAEAKLLRQARRQFSQHCAAEAVLTADQWAARMLAEPALAARQTPLLMAGFEPLGPALSEALSLAGARFVGTPGHASSNAQVEGFADTATELLAAAEWARERLIRDPEARLLLVVPDLPQRRAALTRLLDAALDPASILRGVGASAAHDLDDHRSLSDLAPVSTALGLLRLATAGLEQPELGALLRSTFWSGDAQERALLDAWLREQNLLHADRHSLAALLPRVPERLQATAATLLESANIDWRERAEARLWAERFHARLDAAGWPGSEALGESREALLRAFESALGDFAAFGSSDGKLNAGEAIARLQSLLMRTECRSGSGIAALTVSDSLGDPVVQYDGIRICGLVTGRWPERSSADPFVPLSLQRAAGMEVATAEGRLATARRQLERWRRATPELRLSWAASDADLEQRPSELLFELEPGARGQAPIGRRTRARPLWEELRRGARLERVPLGQRGSVLERGTTLRGGTRIFELQAQCPFRSFAQLRLAAGELAEPVPGLDAREQGILLHGCLQEIWQSLRGQPALLALDAGREQALIAGAVRSALDEWQRKRRVALPVGLLQVEAERLARLLGAELEFERQRTPFRVVDRERKLSFELCGVRLELRIDRIDELEDGSAAIIDYKSGQPVSGAAVDGQPSSYPQLLAYATACETALGLRVSAVAALHLVSRGLALRKAADLPDRLVAQKRDMPDSDWPGTLAAWRAQIEAQLRAHLDGVADVAPVATACRQCSFEALCRVDEVSRLAHSEPVSSEEDDAAEAGHASS